MSVRQLSLATLVSSCAFAGGAFFLVPAALAVTPPVVEEESALNVADTSATLQAKIDPQGSETTYRFEYGTSEAYGSSIPIPDGLVGSGLAGVMISAHPQELSPSTTYHYRVLAVVASRSETVPGSDGTFVTQSAGSKFALPDGRQWELVSPPNKHGALIGSLATRGPIQAAEDGSGIVYGTNVPTELEPPGYGQQGESFLGQVLSARGRQGWSSRDIATPHDSPTRPQSIGAEYLFFSRDLWSGLVDPQGEDATLLSGQASERTPYVRREGLCETPASASECYLPVVTGKEGFADVPPGTKFSEGFPRIAFEGSTPDLSHVVLTSYVALTATPTSRGEIYEWSAGKPASEALQLVSVLPTNEGGGPVAPASGSVMSIGGALSHSLGGARHAVSDDGSRIFWGLSPTEAHEGGGLFMRDIVKRETVRLDVKQPGAPSSGAAEPRFQFATGDGSKVFFTDPQRLTEHSGGGDRDDGFGDREADLYKCEIIEEAAKLKCNLTDLTPEKSGENAEVLHFIPGASEDGSYVYFIANGVLAEGASPGSCGSFMPVSATCNLYDYHNGSINFIATLSAEDELDYGGSNAVFYDTGLVTSRVSPNGRYLAFMSQRSLTEYDNSDASSGKPDQEVYLYDALTKRLSCVSCNPTGSRPVGVEVSEATGTVKPNVAAIEPGAGVREYESTNSIAANLPPGNSIGEWFGESLYQSRYLSDSGRLFFNSSDALAPQDVNGTEDVYEFEPQGIGSCEASSVTLNPKSGGCVSLISSGTSPEESGFMDASEGGGDVFFLTTSRLTSQDDDTARDLYDAHECSASVPCVASPASVPPCNSGDSCKGAPAPQPSIFGTPASATFAGAGNVVVSSKPVVKVKSLTRAQKLARVLRACKKKPGRKRAVCERQAKKRNAVKGTGRVAKATRKGQG